MMHCSDLERYLEACLDGQLGDSRRQALKGHLALCGPCRERVDGLRRFEAELQRRLRSMQHEVSLWEPLGLETVGTAPAVPPRPAAVLPRLALTGPATTTPEGHGRHRLRLKQADLAAARPRRRLQNLAGMAMLVAAVGAVAQATLSGLGWLGGDRRAAVYRAYLEGGVELDLVTAQPAQLSAWLAERLGGPVVLPEAPGSFALIGGKAPAEGLPEGAGMAVYASDAGPALLVIEAAKGPAGTAPALSPQVAVEDGLARVEWHDGPHSYSLFGALPPDKLALFAD